MRRKLTILVLIAIGTVLTLSSVALAQEAGQATTKSWFWWFVWPGGGIIGILLILIDMATWALIIEHFMNIRRTTILPDPVQQQIDQMVGEKRYRDVIEYTSTEPSMLSYVIHQSLTEAAHGYGAMERAMEEGAEERTTKLLRKIELLNIIGNVGPMLGLLGTVFGMIMAFSKIVEEAGMPQPEKLAESVGIALVTTFWGLIVAIPALAVYALMRNRIDALASETMTAAQSVLSSFRPGGKSNG